MAKVYSFEKFKIRQRIKELQNAIAVKTEQAKNERVFWFNHYTILEFHKEINVLSEQLKDLENDTLNIKGEKD